MCVHVLVQWSSPMGDYTPGRQPSVEPLDHSDKTNNEKKEARVGGVHGMHARLPHLQKGSFECLPKLTQQEVFTKGGGLT